MSDPETTPTPAAAQPGMRSERTPSTWDRIAAALERFAARVSEIVRRGNRRRLTLRDRDGTVWLRAPLTLSVIVLLLASASWASVLVVLAAVALFAFGFQVSVERHVDAVRSEGGAPTSAA